MQPEEICRRYNFAKIGEDGILEFYCDHTLLSSLRACEQYFVDTHLKRYRHKDRNWNLEFGQWLHSTLELFYHYEYKKLQRIANGMDECQKCGDTAFVHEYESNFEKPNCDKFVEWDSIPKGTFLAHGMMLWDKMEMEYFVTRHKYAAALGGALGALKLLTDYWNVYGEGKERLRVVGIEMPFGREKEVPIVDTIPAIDKFNKAFTKAGRDEIGFNDVPMIWAAGPYRGYLTGRFDQIIDDGISLAAFDHKSTAFFDGCEASKFMPHDGMQGYVYALDKMVQKLYPDKLANKMVVNHICLQDKSNEKVDPKSRKRDAPTIYTPALRFSRSTLSYTPEQLEEYRRRNAGTFDVLYQILVLERPAQWNTGSCNDMYHKECPFKNIHGITPSVREQIMNQQMVQVDEWNPFYESKAEII